jgi:putative Ig domain-containing protein
VKLTALGLVSGFLLSGLLLACGGGGSNPPANPLSITTTSLQQGQAAVAYNASLSAMGGTAPYMWTLKSGTLPAGLSLSTGGTISGTPTTAGAASITVQVSDSATTPQTADSGNLTLAISGGTLQITSTVATVGTVGTAYNFQLQATGGVPPYTWAVGSGSTLPAGLALSTSGVVSGTPTASGTFNPSIAVTDETTTNTLSQPVAFTINPAGTPLPDGNYAFLFSGTTSDGNAVGINGVFEVALGAVGIGFYSENQLNQAPKTGQAIIGGSASIAANGLGQLELSLGESNNVTFALAAPASFTTPGADSDIRIIEFDDATGTGMRGSGVLKVANFSGVASAIKGGYSFGFSGWDTHSQPTALAGSFQADGLGNITSGKVDMNDNGTLSTFSGVTGTYNTDPVGQGVITLKLAAGNTVTYNYYQVTPTELIAVSGDISSDIPSSTVPLVAGTALQQTGTFSNASLTGVNVLELTGTAIQTAASIPDITLGLLTSDGNGNLTATYDEYKVSLLPPQTYTATYAVDAATGRTPIISGTPKAILYLVSNAKAFVMGADASASSGLLEGQLGSPFTNASLKGNYLGGTIPWPDLQVVSLVAADGAGNAQITSDSSGSKGLLSNQKLSGTYSVDAHGRALFTVSGDATPRIFYVVSPARTVLLSGEAGGYLSSFEQ